MDCYKYFMAMKYSTSNFSYFVRVCSSMQYAVLVYFIMDIIFQGLIHGSLKNSLQDIGEEKTFLE